MNGKRKDIDTTEGPVSPVSTILIVLVPVAAGLLFLIIVALIVYLRMKAANADETANKIEPGAHHLAPSEKRFKPGPRAKQISVLPDGNCLFYSVVIGEKGHGLPSDNLWHEMCNLRARMSDFIRSSADIGWVHEILELPIGQANIRVQPEEYARVKGQPAKDVSEIEKWGDSSDLILLSKLLQRNIICVRPENGVDKATIHRPDDQSVQDICFYDLRDGCYDDLFQLHQAANPIVIYYNGHDHYNAIVFE